MSANFWKNSYQDSPEAAGNPLPEGGSAPVAPQDAKKSEPPNRSQAALCAECHVRPVPSTRRGARFCGGACRTVANRRDRAIRAYAALAAALPGGSTLFPKGTNPALVGAAAGDLLRACRALYAQLASAPHQLTTDDVVALNAAERAIAKAEGR